MTRICILFILTIANPLYAGVITFNDTVELDDFSTSTLFSSNGFKTSTDKNYFNIKLPTFDTSFGSHNHTSINYEISYDVKYSINWTFDKPFQGSPETKINNSLTSIYSFYKSFDDSLGLVNFSSIGATCFLTETPIYSCNSERNFTDTIIGNLELNVDETLKLASQNVLVKLTSRLQTFVPSNDWFNDYDASLSLSLQFSNWHNGVSEVRYSYEDKVIAVDEPNTSLLFLIPIFLYPFYKLTKAKLIKQQGNKKATPC